MDLLQNIQQITDFTYQDDVNMTSANLMVAIRLLVKCDLTLETIESGLQIATSGSKYQYYRAFFLNYEDIIQDQKRALELMTNVSDKKETTSFKPARRLRSSGTSGLTSL